MQIFALVGPSGSGKSHRASLLADELGAELIVDDGLAIRDGKILGGKSAKREANRLAAVRRAIFSDAEHAELVRHKIAEASVEKILIIGTSKTMASKIAEALKLPEPTKYIEIDEVASLEEIQRAHKTRKEQGKHVIPAPTLEVKKTFSGYLVDPLRFFVSRKTTAENIVIEKSVVRPTWSALGKFYIADSVVGAIAVKSCKDVPGIARVRKARIESCEEGVTIDLEVSVLSNVLPLAALRKAQKHVKQTVEHCTALNVLSTNVAARKIVFVDD